MATISSRPRWRTGGGDEEAVSSGPLTSEVGSPDAPTDPEVTSTTATVPAESPLNGTYEVTETITDAFSYSSFGGGPIAENLGNVSTHTIFIDCTVPTSCFVDAGFYRVPIDWSVDGKLEAYEQRGDWKMGGQGTKGLDPFKATFVQFGARYRF